MAGKQVFLPGHLSGITGGVDSHRVFSGSKFPPTNLSYRQLPPNNSLLLSATNSDLPDYSGNNFSGQGFHATNFFASNSSASSFSGSESPATNFADGGFDVFDIPIDQNRLLSVDGFDGSSISESSSSDDSSISVNSYKAKKPRGRHELQRCKGNTSKDAEKKPHALDEEQIEGQNSDLLSDQASTSMKPEIQDADVVTIRAKPDLHSYMIKFKLFMPFGFVKLKQEVAKRLLKQGDERLRGDYTIRYKDEDDELILISCDDDLQLCVNTSRALRKTLVDLLLN